MRTFLASTVLFLSSVGLATDYHVGPGQPLATIGEAPWATLMPGDRVFIHWQATPYFEKWVINRQGTANQPIEVIGVPGPNGEPPVISGNGATTAPGLNFWNDERGVIKIGGSSIPSDGLPQHIVIDGLEVRSAHPNYSFTNDNGQSDTYNNNAASIYVEKAAHLTIRNCVLHDSGNGLFIGAFDGMTEHILVHGNHIHGNGIDGSIYEHNAYTAAIDITFQYNQLGPLRPGAGGNNLKDRSAGLVVRYNWIESGNRQLDLVDAEDSEALVDHWSYETTIVYGNILIEPDGAGNSQMVHYGGDSGTLDDYRKGNLYFYNNTCISTRSGNTTLLRLSTNDESAHLFNNAVYTTASGNHLALVDGNGTVDFFNNWLMENWVDCHCTPNGTLNDYGNLSGTDPGFLDFNTQNFRPVSGSPLVNNGTVVPTFLYAYEPVSEYLEHTDSIARTNDFELDIGAFEYDNSVGWEEIDTTSPAFSVFPVPSQGEVFIRSNRAVAQMELTDLSGRSLRTTSGYIMDLSPFPSGIYLIKVYLFNGQTRTVRVVKH